MYLEIVTPEAVLLSSEVDSVTVPGVEGEFQMLNNHAPIISVLEKGTVKVKTNASSVDAKKLSKNFTRDAADNKVLLLEIDGGVVEMKDNKVIVLAD
ncbi:hypothetical protein GCM10007103_16410 [Salinimicrobium marinum]|uniref:ATP synthase F1 complex delta/epsilon subunit N-terminal domain-containing protein n=1 Tax=Salinimicrobium marinum TaxID=680283 RepID=A0A918SF98_9FLAO|nr:F0F1 ATP synthase subunit epsilon [Salinimicrobium marinum]GHA35691.1 hypothetical protein GCM10007103_16410 [Salinimicrobium marinum]